jgi:NitT/TauT family transport system permease protein
VFLPPLSAVLEAGAVLIVNGQLFVHLATSFVRSLMGFSLAVAIAVPAGLLIGWSRPIADVVSPVVELLRNTAALALLPAFVLVLGIGEASKIALIVYACSWPILLNTISGVREIDPLLLKSASVLGITGLRLFRTVVLPAALPAIVVGVRLAGAVSVLVLVAAEMIGAKAGLGYLVIYSQYNFQIPQMYFGILSITALGVAFNGALVAFERYVVIWKEPSGERK